ncbi:MAG: glutamate--tRNA ligase, partial [Chloroflexota bacterium]
PPHYVGRCARLSPAERRAREREGRRPVIRFRIPPDETVAFDDLVRGRVEIATSALGGDLVIVRSDGTPLYHFSVCVDDAAMAISHIIRGEDHLSNTPKHILLFQALGAPVPAFAHLPLILNPDRTKMSKRKSQTAVADYLAEGFLPEAIVNHLALLGWASGGTEELFSLDELARRFALERVHQAGAVFDRERLDWLNGQWIRRLEPEDLARRLLPFLEADLDRQVALGLEVDAPTEADLIALVPLVQERLPTLAAIGSLVDFLFIRELPVEPSLLIPKRWDRARTVAALHAARQTIAALGEVSYDPDALELALRGLAEGEGWKAGDLFMALRVAVTGRTATPPLFETLVALGYERTLTRLDAARGLLADV